MTEHYSIVVEQESNGSFSAWVAGVPGVYAAADSKAKARHAIRDTLAAHLETLTALGKPVAPRAHVALLQYRAEAPTQKERLRFVGIGAILGRSRSRAKSAAARRNGALGGRPRKPARA